MDDGTAQIQEEVALTRVGKPSDDGRLGATPRQFRGYLQNLARQLRLRSNQHAAPSDPDRHRDDGMRRSGTP
jgi:hypothetical protein